MKEEIKHIISIILPVYNGESTLAETLESLFAQSVEFDELIAINDASADRSEEILKKFLTGKERCRSISHEKNMGLARSYNEGIRLSGGDLVITMHQDVILRPDALKELVAPFSDGRVVAAGHRSIFPYPIWEKFSFWQKCYFARFAGKEIFGINGQFDCFQKEALQKAGLFDEIRFRSAGEDADIVYKLSKLGKIAETKAKLLHLQNSSADFGPKDIIWKQKQHSEARGALLALGRIRGPKYFVKVFFREIMLLALLVPYLNIVSLILMIIYSFRYTGPVYSREFGDKRIIILPFFNIYLLFVSFAYSFRGFVYGKQKI
jgi:GT2 family glycosyltransferase